METISLGKPLYRHFYRQKNCSMKPENAQFLVVIGSRHQIRHHLLRAVGVQLDNVAEWVFCVDSLIPLSREQIPYFAPDASAMLCDAISTSCDIRVNNTDVKETGFPVLEVVFRACGLGAFELKNFQNYAVSPR
jgi:hypothetical protein